MCIAIVKTKKGKITDEQLQNCWNRNQDGAGFAYPKNGEVVIEKGFFKFNDFLKRYRAVEKKVKNNMLIHFRISTAGLVDKNNCHPHRINNKLAMIHNGILHIDVPAKSKVSDTVLYCKNYLQKLPKGFTKNDVIMEYIEENIGSGNKFCFLDGDGHYNILNEKAGEWKDGVWYSNCSYEKPRVTYKYTSKDYEDYYNKYYGSYYGSSWNDDDEEYGFGKVTKWCEDSYCSPEERAELIGNGHLYDVVWENMDELIERVNAAGGEAISAREVIDGTLPDAYVELCELTEDPVIALLSGNIYSPDQTQLQLKDYNSVRLSAYDDYMYEEYRKVYDAMVQHINDAYAEV